jgi:uncharacterized low-complexity protein
MNHKKMLPVLVLALGMASQMAAHADLFQMTEVSGHGLQVAAGADDNKCGAGSCGAAKPGEKKEAGKADSHKCAGGKCGADKGGKDADKHCSADKYAKGDAHKCGADGRKHKGCTHKHGKGDAHKCGTGKCGADKKGKSDAHQCGADKNGEHKCASDKKPVEKK